MPSHGKRSEIARRDFLKVAGATSAALGVAGVTGQAAAADPPRDADGKIIPGFDDTGKPTAEGAKEPVGDRKIKVGIAGYGLCSMGAQFGFQNHPNVEVVAVTDLIPARRAGLAKACRCEKTYDSCEEMIKDDNIDAVFIATDALERILHRRDGRKLQRGFLHGQTQHRASPAGEEQRLRKPIRF